MDNLSAHKVTGLEELKHEHLRSHSRSRGFECYAIRAHTNEQVGLFFCGLSVDIIYTSHNEPWGSFFCFPIPSAL